MAMNVGGRFDRWIKKLDDLDKRAKVVDVVVPTTLNEVAVRD